MSSHPLKEHLLIIDFGSQFSNLISHKLIDLSIAHQMISAKNFNNIPPHCKGIILSGGPRSVYEDPDLEKFRFIFGKVPVLGICYGKQIIHHLLGGEVCSAPEGNYGKTEIIIHPHPLTKGLSPNINVWCSHFDHISKLAPDFILLSDSSFIQIAANDELKLYTTQFHPETESFSDGGAIINNFVKLTQIKSSSLHPDIIQKKIAEIRTIVGSNKVSLALSGGVDSAVLSFLLTKAIGSQLSLFFVDTGLLRAGDLEQVSRYFPTTKILSASKEFLKALKGKIKPEEKRLAIGHTFISIFEQNIQDCSFLAQGTILSDKIESGEGTSSKIKSHHNVGGLPKTHLKILEPLKDLFKNEVILLGKKLKVPEEILTQQPFPGPGLAIRISGEVNQKRLETVRKAELIVRDYLTQHQIPHSQAFPILIPNKSVGVKGDNRVEGSLILIRVIHSINFMTAQIADISHHHLTALSSQLINKLPEITRVAYDITSKPPGTIEWE